MDDFPILATRRLVLREITPVDASVLLAIHSDRDAMRWYGADPLNSIGEAEQLIALFAEWRKHPNPGTRWGIELGKSGTLIGTCGFYKWNRQWSTCHLSFELARDTWGQGYMLEALRTALEWGFQHMKLRRVEALVHPENRPSIKLLSELHFVQEGRLRSAGFWRQRPHDLFTFGLLREEY
jgi:ribosomal-protein-alanine N-acetyltransferase